MRYTGSPLEHGSKILPDTPAYDVKAHLAYVQELHAKYPLNSVKKIDQHVAELCANLSPCPYAIINEIYAATIHLYRKNDISYALCPTYEIRSLLEQDVHNLANPSRIDAADKLMKEFWQGFTDGLPDRLFALEEFERDRSKGTWVQALALYSMERIRHVTGACFGVIGREEIGGRTIFQHTTSLLKKNAIRASGHDPENFDGKKKVIWPSESKLDGADLVVTYLEGSGFETVFAAPVPFEIPEETRFAHTWMVAGSGAGKTTALTSMLLSDIEKVMEGKCSVVLLDSQNQLIPALSRLKQFAPTPSTELAPVV